MNNYSMTGYSEIIQNIFGFFESNSQERIVLLAAPLLTPVLCCRGIAILKGIL